MTPQLIGSDSSHHGLPSRLAVTPAPSRSTTARSSRCACRAPWPTSTATRCPSLRTAAAEARASGCGTTTGRGQDTVVGTTPCSCGVPSGAASFWTSWGTITTQGERVASAVRNARSTTMGACSADSTVCTNCAATSLKSDCRSISCWYSEPSTVVSCWPMIATTGTWSSLAS